MNSSRIWRLASDTVAAIVFLLLILPMMVVIVFSFSERSFFTVPPSGFSLRWYKAAWESGLFLAPALRSLALAALSTTIAAALSVPAALSLRRMRPSALRSTLEFAFLSPLIVPALIVGIALLYAYNRLGILDTFAGLVIAHTLIVFPFMLRAVLTSVMALKESLLEASEILGASPIQTLRHIILPGIVPGIVAGATFSVIVSLDQFTVSLFVTQSEQVVLPVAIYKYLFDVNDPVAAAVSTVLVLFGLLAAFVIDRLGWLRHLSSMGA